MFIDEEIEFIKSQIDHHRRSVEHFYEKRDHIKVKRHQGILRRFEQILPKIHKCNAVEAGAKPSRPESDKIGSRLGDLSDLPEEIRSQLVSVQRDELEQRILDVVAEAFDGVATIDEIMVGLYRHAGEIHKREALATKIYRMTKKELLFSVPLKKGVYSLQAATDPASFETEDNGDDT